jgi:hypothetical protein
MYAYGVMAVRFHSFLTSEVDGYEWPNPQHRVIVVSF